MTDLTLWAQRGPIEPHWQLGDLGAVAAPQALLLGWDAPDALDGGVPPRVADVWSRAMAETARVTFLCSEPVVPTSTDWLESGDGNEDFTKCAPAPSLLASGLAWLRGPRAAVALVCTTRSARIAKAFDDSNFAWWLQSQVLLLSPLAAAPPAIAPDTVLALLGDDWATRAAALRRHGVVAVARPAVDGDGLGLSALEEGLAERLITAIERETRAAALGWSVRG